MAKRVLVVGGSGFVGSHVCNALEKKGIDAIVLSRRSTMDASGVDTWITQSFGAFLWVKLGIFCHGTRWFIAPIFCGEP